MGFVKLTWVFLFCWAFSSLCFRAHSAAPLLSLKLSKAPHAFSHLSSATFVFDVLVGGNGHACSDCSLTCKLDDGVPSDCVNRKVSYTSLQDGNHTFEVCSNGSYGVGCSSYNWTVDTVPPTAYVTAPTSFTNALNFSVNISFSEPCIGRGGFGCSSVNACNLLVYGAGQVLPSSFQILQPNLKYSLLVGLSSTVQYGRVILVMDKNFCSDAAGNSFTRTDNSSFYVHFDRRNVSTNLRTRIPERLVQLNSATRTVQATNDYSDLKVYLNFSEPVLNSSTEVLSTLTVSQGSLLPTSGKSLGNRRFGFLVANVSTISIVTVNLDSTSIISRQGTPVSPIAPLTFLYDSQRPIARLSTTANMRTKEHTIPISVKFTKPVFGFNSSCLSISGGHLQNFREISTSIYTVDIRADDEFISVNVPENVTGDIAGNMNLASNILQVRHYSVPKIAFIVTVFATAAFVATSFVAGLLTISIASLQSVGAFSRSTLLLTNPARNLFKIAFYIQVFALSRWLAVTLPVEYYEFARGLQWSIPYFHLPWECGQVQPVMVGSTPVSVHSYMSEIPDVGALQNPNPTEDNLSKAASLYGLPLTPGEYRLFFESQNMKPEAEFITDPKNSNGWRDFDRSMFWLAVIAGSLILLHALALFILRFRKKHSEKKRDYGQLTLPRFEIFLIILALPCLSEASASLIRGGTSSGIIVGILFLGFVAFVLLALLLFLTVGITFGKLLQYKEVHQEGEKFHWYQDIVRVTLGPGKRGQWTWKNQTSSIYLIIFGPLFEDLRGPPKYMLTQISGSNPHKYGDSIIASEDENEDAEAPFIQKLFGILRIYYTLLESVKRVTLGIVAGAYMEDWWSRTPTIALLSITSFQLFFLVLKKPFIKKKVQLVEIIAISCEVGLFATGLVLSEKDLSAKCESKVGIFMITLFLLGFLPQMINQWYALYRQIKRLDPADKSFLLGLKVASIGILVFLIPEKFTKKLESRLPMNLHWNKAPTDPGSSAERHESSGSRSSGATESWLKQLREMAKASFSKEGNGGPTDPSSSGTARWSEFWSKRSGSSSVKTSTDMKAQPRKGLYKDLEDIFASK